VATIKGKEVKFSNHQSLLWEFQKSRPTNIETGGKLSQFDNLAI